MGTQSLDFARALVYYIVSVLFRTLSNNSAIFRARSPKFCMQVDLDRPQPFRTKKVQKNKKYISTKVLITEPFFELQTPDFAWKFISTVEPNDKVQKYKNTKVQKYKSTKYKTKKYKNTKTQKNTRK